MTVRHNFTLPLCIYIRTATDIKASFPAIIAVRNCCHYPLYHTGAGRDDARQLGCGGRCVFVDHASVLGGPGLFPLILFAARRLRVRRSELLVRVRIERAI